MSGETAMEANRLRTVYLSFSDADARNWRDWSWVKTVSGLSTWMLKASTAGQKKKEINGEDS